MRLVEVKVIFCCHFEEDVMVEGKKTESVGGAGIYKDRVTLVKILTHSRRTPIVSRVCRDFHSKSPL